MPSTSSNSGHWLGWIKTSICDRASPRLGYQQLETCLENEVWVCTTIHQSLLETPPTYPDRAY